MNDIIEFRPYQQPPDEELLAKAKPCPFCGGSDLTTSLWCDDDGEYTAIACRQCQAEAPATTWNQRPEETPCTPKT